MTTYIPHTTGKVYDVAHLRPFDLDLAKQGHPLATNEGPSVRLFRESATFEQTAFYLWDEWGDPKENDGYAIWRLSGDGENAYEVGKRLRLAPLAIKHDPRTSKDEPLHVDDVIEIKGSPNYGEPWLPHIVGAGSLIGKSDDNSWRWPVGVLG